MLYLIVDILNLVPNALHVVTNMLHIIVDILDLPLDSLEPIIHPHHFAVDAVSNIQQLRRCHSCLFLR
jgi:hypothetical protein